MTHAKSAITSLTSDSEGATIVEFAFVAPVLILLVMGTLDIGHAIYTRSVLEGEIQKAARASTMETASMAVQQAQIDADVAAIVRKIAGTDAQLQFERKAYGTYKSARRKAEEYVDTNNNGECDAGESFEDSNGDGIWSDDAGIAGQGKARDVQQYTVTVRYDRKFPTSALLGWSEGETLIVRSVLRNQPFNDAAPPAVGTCD
jgi:Flp pilus assembly protein TadG